MINILNYDINTLSTWLTTQGEPSYRAVQIIQWLHQKRVFDFTLMTNLNNKLRTLLQEHFVVTLPTILSEKVASDGTVKWLLAAEGGNAIETVFIPEANRATLCVSSQIGCALACRFCLTGDQGFNRSLSTGEIIGQVLLAANRISTLFNYPPQAISNIVFMGMGEPLTNEQALYPALRLLLSDHAYGLSKYRVTVSTSGIVPAMERLKEESPCALAVSLHAPNNTLRDEIVPINKKYPLEKLLTVCQNYFPPATKRGIVFEYVMLEGVNDHLTHAKELTKIMHTMPYAKINLIPFNTYPAARYTPTPLAKIKEFQRVLANANIVTTIRKTRGDDILAACGQLAGQVKNRLPSHSKRLNEAS